MSQRPSISPYTDAICHMSGCYVPKTLYQPIIRTLYAIWQDGMARRVAAYTRVRSWIHIILTKKKKFSKKNVVWNSAFARLAVKCRLVEINESKAIHLHFYDKINGFSLVKKALRRPQNAPNCTIYFKIFRGACPLTPLDYFESTLFTG